MHYNKQVYITNLLTYWLEYGILNFLRKWPKMEIANFL